MKLYNIKHWKWCFKLHVLRLHNWFNNWLQEPENQTWFLVEIYGVGEGAAINESARFANITLVESDTREDEEEDEVMVFFALGSRLPVVHLESEELNLQIQRDTATKSITVDYYMEVGKKDHASMSSTVCSVYK